MRVVEVQLRADELARRTTEMRAWLARHKTRVADITHTRVSSSAVARVILATADAETFAKRFGGRVVAE
jgi:hypothetical protein